MMEGSEIHSREGEGRVLALFQKLGLRYLGEIGLLGPLQPALFRRIRCRPLSNDVV